RQHIWSDRNVSKPEHRLFGWRSNGNAGAWRLHGDHEEAFEEGEEGEEGSVTGVGDSDTLIRRRCPSGSHTRRSDEHQKLWSRIAREVLEFTASSLAKSRRRRT